MATNKKKITIISLLSTLLLIGIVFLTSKLGQQRQEIRKEAANLTGTGTVTASLSPASGNYFVGDSFSTDIKIKPVSASETISIVQIILTYSYTGATSEIEIQDADTITDGIQIQSSIPALNYTTLNKVTTDSQAKKVTIQIMGYSYTGYSLNQEVTFARINFLVKAPTSGTGISISFDNSQNLNRVIRKSDGKDILVPPTARALYQTNIDNIPPETTISTGPTEGEILRVKNTSLSFSGSDNRTAAANLVYSWKLDGPTAFNWSTYSSAMTAQLSNLADGNYSFSVRAKDEVGLVDASPATRSFSLDTKVYLNFSLKFQGITNSPAYGATKTINLLVKNTAVNQAVSLNAGAQGIYSNSTPVNLDNLTAGSYEVLIKGPAHLQKRFTETLAIGNNQKDWTTTPLRAGDLAGGGIEGDQPDNMIEAADLGKLIALFNPTGSVPAGTPADLNSDGKVDMLDAGLLLSNYQPGIYGDQ